MKKRVLICGIAEDITEQICVELISSGHTIVLADTNWELGTRIQEDLSQYGHISFIRGKTADYKEINSLFEKTAGIMGGTDYIINIFRLPEGKDSVYTVSNSEWEKNIAEYINPLFTMSRIWGEKINSSSGCIINIAYKKTPGSYSFQAAFLKDTICSLTEHISKYCPVNAFVVDDSKSGAGRAENIVSFVGIVAKTMSQSHHILNGQSINIEL